MNQNESSRIDWAVTVIPFVVILVLCFLFLAFPTQSNLVISQVRFFMGDSLGLFYLLIGLGIFIASLIAAFSRVGRIVLGDPDEKPKYSFFAWGSMMFTAGLAADILFYSFSEWILYATDSSIMSSSYRWELASMYPLFHWSFIPWGFYLMLAVAFGFIAAAVSGYIAIKWVLDLIQNKSLDIFAYYCWAIGIIIFMGSITNLF